MSESGVSQPFDPRLMAGLIVAGILAFLGFFVLSAYAGDLRSGRDGRAHPLSVSAIGYKGLVDLVGYSGGKAELGRIPAQLDTEDLVVVTIDEATDKRDLAALLERRGAKATLLVLPKWTVGPHPLRRSWVTEQGAGAGQGAARLLPEFLPADVRYEKSAGRVRGRGFLADWGEAPPPRVVQTIGSSDKFEPLLVTGRGGTVLAQSTDRGQLYLLADPDLINNQGLRDRERARNALKLITMLNSTGAESVVFDLTLSGFRPNERNLLKLAFEPPFVALTVAVLITALLAGLHGLAGFGPRTAERRAIALGKAALVENSAGLVRLARREHRIGGHYADVVRDSAAHAAGAPASLSGPALESYLDRISKPGTARFSDLAAPMRGAADRDSMLAAARALFQWKKDITR